MRGISSDAQVALTFGIGLKFGRDATFLDLVEMYDLDVRRLFILLDIENHMEQQIDLEIDRN